MGATVQPNISYARRAAAVPRRRPPHRHRTQLCITLHILCLCCYFLTICEFNFYPNKFNKKLYILLYFYWLFFIGYYWFICLRNCGEGSLSQSDAGFIIDLRHSVHRSYDKTLPMWSSNSSPCSPILYPCSSITSARPLE
jgi:hypothetical protein